MRVGLDTSVIVRLLTGDPEPQANAAWHTIAELRSDGDEATVSDLVVSEAYFALHYHYRVPKEEALSALRDLLTSGHVTAMGSAARVLALPGLATANPGFVDRLIHASYLETADQMLTFEKAARKLGKTRVLVG
jgi:predicted nucleic-acid-binding protein